MKLFSVASRFLILVGLYCCCVVRLYKNKTIPVKGGCGGVGSWYPMVLLINMTGKVIEFPTPVYQND